MSRQTVDSGQLLAERPVAIDETNRLQRPRSSSRAATSKYPITSALRLGEAGPLERFDRTIYLFDVELDHERNRRQRKNCQHVEITARGTGPVAAARPAPTVSTPRWNPR